MYGMGWDGMELVLSNIILKNNFQHCKVVAGVIKVDMGVCEVHKHRDLVFSRDR
jgi:hypothetical protein